MVSRRNLLKKSAAAVAGAATTSLSGCLYPAMKAQSDSQNSPTFSSTSNPVTRKQATTVTKTAGQLVSALLNEGATIWIPGDAKIDMSDYSGLYIADGVTIASNRGIGGAGGLITYSSTGQNLFVAHRRSCESRASASRAHERTSTIRGSQVRSATTRSVST